MPDFNLRNPAVIDYHSDSLRFWLNKGVDGFRFDAVGVLFENGPSDWNNQPENHLLMNDVLSIVTGYQKRFMVCEAPDNPGDFAATTSCGRAFAFQTPGAILNSARGLTVDGTFVNQLALANTDRMPLILSNHDSFAGDRIWNQLNGDAEAYKLAAASYLLAAATPFTYYGEEVGMANAAVLSGDHALRTPMSWTSDPNTAGFTAVTPFRALSANATTNNVQDAEGDSNSLLEYYRGLYELRQSYPLVATGALNVQSSGGDPVLLLTRSGPGASAVVAINYDSTSNNVSAATTLTNATFNAVFGATGQSVSDGAGSLTIDVPARSAVVYVGGP